MTKSMTGGIAMLALLVALLIVPVVVAHYTMAPHDGYIAQY